MEEDKNLDKTYRLSPNTRLSVLKQMWMNEFFIFGHWVFGSVNEDVIYQDWMTLEMIGETSPRIVTLKVESIEPESITSSDIEDNLKDKHLHVGAQVVPNELDIFISYQWESKTIVREICRNLTDNGYCCWLDERRMEGGDPLYQEINLGLQRCKVMLACVTTKYTESLNCDREIYRADNLIRNEVGNIRKIIPLKIEDMMWLPKVENTGIAVILSGLIYVEINEEEVHQWRGKGINQLMDQLKSTINEETTSESGDGAKLNRTFKDKTNKFAVDNEILKVKNIESGEIQRLKEENERLKRENTKLREENDSLSRMNVPQGATNSGPSSLLTMHSKQTGVKLIIYYLDYFSPAARPEVEEQGFLWSKPYVKCQIPGIRTGSSSFEEIRTGMQLILKGPEIQEIHQCLGSVKGKMVAWATPCNEDESVNEDWECEYCDIDGTEYSWEEAGKPGWQVIRSGGSVFICGGGRRTVLMI